MNIRTSLFPIFSLLLLSACAGSSLPVMGERTCIDVDVEELSGLCLNKAGTAMIACGDQGVVKTVTFTGFVLTLWEHYADLEGVTVDPRTGDLYLAAEWDQKIYRLSAPDYTDHSTMFYVQDAVDGDYRNGGLEGVEYYKDDMLFVGSQENAYLWIYKTDGTLVSRTSVSDFATEIAGMCYDPVSDRLWIVDSNTAMLHLCTPEGALITSYSVEGIENAESVCVDRERDCVWVGSDEENPKIYKIEFKF